jgi:hypothetical protein
MHRPRVLKHRTILRHQEHRFLTATTSASHSRDRAAIQRATSMAIERPHETSSYDACKESSADRPLAAERMEPDLTNNRTPWEEPPRRCALRTRKGGAAVPRSVSVARAVRRLGSGRAWHQQRRSQLSDHRQLHHDATDQLAKSELLHQPPSPQSRVRRSYRS